MTTNLGYNDTWHVALGAQYKYNRNITVGGAYALARVRDMPMNVSRGPAAGTVSGSYKDTAIHALTLNMNYKF